MNLVNIKKLLAYAGGAILIGVLSNALWDFLFKPSLLTVQDILLNLSTLGIQQFKDSMYADIAKGHYDRASLQLLLHFVALSSGALVGITGIFFMKSRTLWGRHKRAKETVRSLAEEESASKVNDKEPVIDEIETVTSELGQIESRLKMIDRLIYFTALLFLVLVTGNLLSTVRIKYVDSAITYFNQILSIARPYLKEPGKEELIRSAFSQIKNKDDYEKLIVELRAIVKRNGQHVPDFSIW